ncbi:restriction endonuclease subunit S [Aliivibrio fischeri]|uniref:Restriction endonuclease subunit S n=1 Tax=Aliivibrio fischeri TaxID=668 RepID=A0A844P747_ALIFS|nr:restriction endonuclease subunit S [Aliivibrio fischeri]MUK50926.1 restriction endonuclease subunit S [Aliivibrio fischeri]
MSVERLITDNIDVWTSTVKTKSASGRGSSKKIELYGIKKLRELILELAVRGKLVPQDPTDEPASVLLERIAEEKAQLIKDKKIKKNRKQPTITQEEIYFPVPANWGYARLEDIYDVRDGTHDSPKPTLEGYPLVTSKNLSSGKLDLSDVKLISKEDHLKVQERSCVDRDDILFAMIGSIGNPVIVDIDVEFSIKNVGLFKYYNRLLSCPNYLNYFLKYAAEIMKKQSAGGVQPFVSLGKLRGFVMLLPPLAEQNRIVTKVDELMSLCDQLEQQTETSIEAHQTLVEVLLNTLTSSADAQELMQNWQRISEHFDALFTTEKSIDTLKQTILQLAVMGKLVPQDPNDEPAVKLLERIAEEKAQLIKDKKIKKQKALPEITEDEKPFDLPSGWEWCRVQDVAQFTTSGSRDWAKYYSDSGALFVTMGNLSRGNYQLRLDNLRYVQPPEGGEGSRTKLEAHDLLISITGDVGNLGLIPEGFGEAYINQHTCLLRFMFECQDKYFPDFMRSPLAKYQFDAPQRGIKNSFRLSDVGEMLLPLPPQKERKRVAKKVEDLMIICDQLKTRLKESQTTQLHLTDAIIDKAL